MGNDCAVKLEPPKRKHTLPSAEYPGHATKMVKLRHSDANKTEGRPLFVFLLHPLSMAFNERNSYSVKFQ